MRTYVPMTTNSQTAQPPLLTISEAATLLRCSAPTVRRKISDGELTAYRLGSHTGDSVRVPRRRDHSFLNRYRVNT